MAQSPMKIVFSNRVKCLFFRPQRTTLRRVSTNAYVKYINYVSCSIRETSDKVGIFRLCRFILIVSTKLGYNTNILS